MRNFIKSFKKELFGGLDYPVLYVSLFYENFLFLLKSRFVDLISLDNDIAGVEYVEASAKESPWGGATVQDSLIVGHSELREIGAYKLGHVDQTRCTTHGVWLPKTSRLTISNVDFVNFDESGCTVFGTCAHCKPDDGAAFIRTNTLRLTSSPNLIMFDHPHASILEDADGSLTGIFYLFLFY